MKLFTKTLAIFIIIIVPFTAFAQQNYSGRYLHYNYVQAEGFFPQMKHTVFNNDLDISGARFGLQASYALPSNLFFNSSVSHLSMDDSDGDNTGKVSADGSIQTVNLLAGYILTLSTNFDIRFGAGWANDKYNIDYKMVNTPLGQSIDKTENNVLYLAGVKFGAGDFMDFDLVYKYEGGQNFFGIGGQVPISMNLGIEVGYNFTTEGKYIKEMGEYFGGIRYNF